MLADQATRIAPVTASLAAKAWGVSHILQSIFTELIRIVDLTACNIGHGHFRCGSQIKALLSFQPKGIFSKFWQLARTGQRCFVDDVGDVNFPITVFLRVRIQHKLRQGPMKSREVSRQE